MGVSRKLALSVSLISARLGQRCPSIRWKLSRVIVLWIASSLRWRNRHMILLRSLKLYSRITTRRPGNLLWEHDGKQCHGGVGGPWGLAWQKRSHLTMILLAKHVHIAAAIWLRSENLNEWIHATFHVHGGVAGHANSTRQCLIGLFLILRGEWGSQGKHQTSVST